MAPTFTQANGQIYYYTAPITRATADKAFDIMREEVSALIAAGKACAAIPLFAKKTELFVAMMQADSWLMTYRREIAA